MSDDNAGALLDAAADSDQMTGDNAAAATVPCQQGKKLFVEFQLTQSGAPVNDTSYQLKLPDGRNLTGTTDARGSVRIEDIDKEGDCVISFPDLDALAHPAGTQPDGDLIPYIQGTPATTATGNLVKLSIPDWDLGTMDLQLPDVPVAAGSVPATALDAAPDAPVPDDAPPPPAPEEEAPEAESEDWQMDDVAVLQDD